MKKPLIVITAVLLCAACAPTPTTSPAPASSPSETTSPSTTATLSANSGPQAPGGTVPATIGIAWDQASKDQAIDIANRAMRDFARPKVEEGQWSNDLARWLTVQATADYSSVDPANIPASRVTGAAVLTVDETNGFGVTASVPTNAGTYELQLLRTTKAGPWKVNRLSPPTP